ncbi:MAG: DUF4384 domain-containing protein [Planctomycetota bacterium]|jgi:hypothetical protein
MNRFIVNIILIIPLFHLSFTSAASVQESLESYRNLTPYKQGYYVASSEKTVREGETRTRGLGGARPGHTIGDSSDKNTDRFLKTISNSYGEGYSETISDFITEAGQEPIKTSGVKMLEVEMDIVKEAFQGGQYQAVPISDGDTLTGNDSYKVRFRCNIECFMYIAQIDSTGKLDPIFPSKHVPGNNPLQAGILYSAPPGANWFYLDENAGKETLYIVASLSRKPEIEELFQKVTKQNMMLVQKYPVSIQEPVIITRGLGGSRPGQQQTVQFKDGSKGKYASSVFKSSGADFTLTRWFHHR